MENQSDGSFVIENYYCLFPDAREMLFVTLSSGGPDREMRNTSSNTFTLTHFITMYLIGLVTRMLRKNCRLCDHTYVDMLPILFEEMIGEVPAPKLPK